MEKNGVVWRKKAFKIGISEAYFKATWIGYYVYQATPYDLYGPQK